MKQSLNYRKMNIDEAERISEIDATHFIRNAWRADESGKYRLTEINWTDKELPNGLEWHISRFKQALADGGAAFGCFDGTKLVGYAVVNSSLFGETAKYALLDQLFVSKNYRGQGIGKWLFSLCAGQAAQFGADKLFICAGSAENTIAFYSKIGCVSAAEHNERLYKEDPRDIQLEYCL